MSNLRNQIYLNIDKSNKSNSEKLLLKEQVDVLNNQNLPIIFDTTQIYQLFDITDDFNTEKECLKYDIFKSNGTIRTVYQPSIKLKKIQRWILKNILKKIQISESAHAFQEKKSILTNAQAHTHNGELFFLYVTDIENFFDSIVEKKVIEIFRSIGYSDDVSRCLTSFCCIDSHVVQGFPTSPAISNIIFKKIDDFFNLITINKEMVYSRYADDIFISGLEKSIEEISQIETIVKKTIEKNDFHINKSKTRLLSLKDDKKITGLMVRDNSVYVPQKIKRLIEKEIYFCERYGVNSHLRHVSKIARSNYKGYLYGYANFVKMVEEKNGKNLLFRLNEIFE